MAYEVTNVTRGSIGPENLDTTSEGKLEVFSLGPKETTKLSDEQFASKRIQRHIQLGRLRARQTR